METSNCKHWSRSCIFTKECESQQRSKSAPSKMGDQGLQLDTSMNEMEETRFRKKYAPVMKQLLPQVHFNYYELELLMIIYYKIQKKNGEKAVGMTRLQFRDILHSTFDMTDDTMMERIYIALDKGPKISSATPMISMQSWAYTLSLFLRGTLEEKIEFCFHVYDTRNEGFLTRETIFKLLKFAAISMAEDESDEAIKDIAEIVAKKLDLDRDGKISFDDYRTSVLRTPMLMEVLGPCLPSRAAVHAFLTTFTELTGKF